MNLFIGKEYYMDNYIGIPVPGKEVEYTVVYMGTRFVQDFLEGNIEVHMFMWKDELLDVFQNDVELAMKDRRVLAQNCMSFRKEKLLTTGLRLVKRTNFFLKKSNLSEKRRAK